MDPPLEETVFRAVRIVEVLRGAGHQAYFAGGCVRDRLLGRPVRDIDIATSARPDQVETLFDRTIPVGRAFGVVQVVTGGAAFDVATFRVDLGYSDGRRPDAVTFSTPRQDAQRRDFTINGLFYDPIDEEVLDFVDGRRDLRRKVVRTIGPPADRFAEDDLRMMRAVRFASVLGFRLDPDTERAIRAHASRIIRISPERVGQEFTRILVESPRAGEAVRLLDRCGLLAPILPEVAALHGVAQPPEFHPEGDVWTHTMMMLDRMPHPTPTLAYAVLLHDVGKPPTATRQREPDGSERIRFNRHASVGAEMADSILRRLRLPQRQIQAVAHCVRNHMRFMDIPRMREATRRRLVAALTFPVELELHRLDCLCSHGDLRTYDELRAYTEFLRDAPQLPPRWITGHDLLAMGIPAGPEMGHWLRIAYDAQLEGRAASRDGLLAWLKEQFPPPTI